MLTYAIVAARSGSKGLPHKNIRPLAGHPLIAHSIGFAKALGCDRVLCSTDSPEYAEIAARYGAETPFMRSAQAASDTAMEEDILRDLSSNFREHDIEPPALLVWLRPTFVFRDLAAIRRCVEVLKADDRYSAARTVCESEGRLYRIGDDDVLTPDFDDRGRSMIRRQDIGARYKVFSTDVIRFDPETTSSDFLGRNVFGIPVHKICGMDIDDLDDFRLVEAVIKGDPALVADYMHL